MKLSAWILTLSAVMMLFASGCTCKKVTAGHVGIKVNLLGGEKGVESEEVGVGRYYLSINEELYLFPTFKQNYVWTADVKEGSENDESFTFQTVDGMDVGADIGITYTLEAKKIHSLFQKYKRGVDEITDTFLRNYVRDALNAAGSTMPVESVYGEGKAKLITDVQTAVANQVGHEGILIEKIYLIGKFRLPEIVITAINNKIKATQESQQRENEVKTAKAEADKSIQKARGQAESLLKVAKAQAEANKILSKSLTPTLVQYKKIEKWDGVMPKVAGGATPIISMDGKKF